MQAFGKLPQSIQRNILVGTVLNFGNIIDGFIILTKNLTANDDFTFINLKKGSVIQLELTSNGSEIPTLGGDPIDAPSVGNKFRPNLGSFPYDNTEVNIISLMVSKDDTGNEIIDYNLTYRK